jgi:hypothetical protein
MSQKKRRSLTTKIMMALGAGALISVVVYFSGFRGTVALADIPYKACLTKYPEPYAQLGQVQTKDAEYFLVSSGPASSYKELVIRLPKDSSCSVENKFNENGAIPIIKYIPRNIAVDLRTQQFTDRIKKLGGREQFQKIIDDIAKVDPKSLIDWDIAEAYKKLNIQVPKSFQVIEDQVPVPQRSIERTPPDKHAE